MVHLSGLSLCRKSVCFLCDRNLVSNSCLFSEYFVFSLSTLIPPTLCFESLREDVNAGLPRGEKSETLKIPKSNALLDTGKTG